MWKMLKINLIVVLGVISICLAIVIADDQTVAFSAIKAERNGPYLSFQTLLVNSSAKFNPLYGVLICSEPGIYFFTFNILSHQDSDLRVSLRVNRIPVITAFSGSKTSFNMASGSTLLQLEMDDIVYCYIEEGDFYESRQVNRAYTSFSGYKIGSNGSGGGFLSSLMGRKSGNEPNMNSNEKKFGNNSFNQIDDNDNIFNLLNNSTIH